MGLGHRCARRFSFASMTFPHCLRLCLLIALFTLQGRADVATVALQTKRSWSFADDGITFSNEFSEARLNECERIGPLEYRITISPENVPINPSPWYAFKLTSAKPQTITLR